MSKTSKPGKGLNAVQPLKTGSFDAAGNYTLSAEENAQDCKRIRGKMGVRIVQLQRTGIVRDSSTLSRKFSQFVGGSVNPRDVQANRKRDHAILRAYNARLAQKKCETIDLAKELARRFPKAAKGTSSP